MKLSTDNIFIFDRIEAVRDKNGIKYGDWAIASNIEQPRISELKKISRLHKTGKINEEKVGRAFTLGKVEQLMKGMIKLIGEEKTITELNKQLKKAKNKSEADLIKYIFISQTEPDYLSKQMDIYLGMKFPGTKEK